MKAPEARICLVAAVLMLVEVAVLESRAMFLLAGLVTGLGAIALVHVVVKRRGEGHGPLLYAMGLIAAIVGYCYLALAPSGALSPSDEVLDWGRMDKRALVFAYLGIAAFIAFHWLWVAFFHGAPVGVDSATGTSPSWPTRLVGGIAIAGLAYCLIGLPALRSVGIVSDTELALFFDIHSHVHLGGLQQIKLGAKPYLEAQTQYGPGNQLLLGAITDLVHFSSQGFAAANILLNVICTAIFFVVLQQFTGFRWAAAGVIGWLLWPSPTGVAQLVGWGVFTRWLAIPVLSLWLAWLLLGSGAARRGWLAPSMAGLLWGASGFLSQESLTGGFLVFGFSLALFGPASGMTLRALARFAALFVVSGGILFVALVSSFVGPSHFPEVLALANAKSSLVMAGISNSIWSTNLGLQLALNIVNGRLQSGFSGFGEFRQMLLTYSVIGLLLLAIGILAAFLGRKWQTADETARSFVQKFAGVTVGSFVLHLFTLMRADTTHLAGASFLLPLFLLMLPLFAWRCLRPGTARTSLVAVSLILIVEAAIVGRGDIEKRVAGLGATWRDSVAVLDFYRELRSHRGDASDLAVLYSPIPRYQAAFRNHPDFAEAEELFRLLSERLHGRRVEMGTYKFNDLVAYPDLFYFLGGLRSLSGITSPLNSIWLRSEQEAWIAKVASARSGCLFFDFRSNRKLVEAWMESVKPPATMEIHQISGKRDYGTLACKGGA